MSYWTNYNFSQEVTRKSESFFDNFFFSTVVKEDARFFFTANTVTNYFGMCVCSISFLKLVRQQFVTSACRNVTVNLCCRHRHRDKFQETLHEATAAKQLPSVSASKGNASLLRICDP